MADRELRKMNRAELIEIIYALQKDENEQRVEIERLRAQLDERILRIENAGSIAEAALSVNHIFEDAQNAAEQYLESIRVTQETAEAESQRIVSEAETQAKIKTAETDAQVRAMIRAAEKQAEEIRTEAESQANEILAAAKAQADEIIASAKTQTNEKIAVTKAQTERTL